MTVFLDDRGSFVMEFTMNHETPSSVIKNMNTMDCLVSSMMLLYGGHLSVSSNAIFYSFS